MKKIFIFITIIFYYYTNLYSIERNFFEYKFNVDNVYKYAVVIKSYISKYKDNKKIKSYFINSSFIIKFKILEKSNLNNAEAQDIYYIEPSIEKFNSNINRINMNKTFKIFKIKPDGEILKNEIYNIKPFIKNFFIRFPEKPILLNDSYKFSYRHDLNSPLIIEQKINYADFNKKNSIAKFNFSILEKGKNIYNSTAGIMLFNNNSKIMIKKIAKSDIKLKNKNITLKIISNLEINYIK